MSRIDDQSRRAGEAPSDEERFRRLIEADADGMLVVDPDGTIGFANPAACDLLGRPASDLVGRSFGLPIVPGETAEIDIRRPDGEARVAEMRSAATMWQGRPSHLATLRDITERKRATRRNYAGRIAGRMSSSRCSRTSCATRWRRSATPSSWPWTIDVRGSSVDWSWEVVDHQCKHLGRLVDDLLDVSRITRGKIQLRRELVEVAPIRSSAPEAVRPLAALKRIIAFIQLVISAPRGLWLESDPTRLEQVLVNLLTNAAKYTEPGGRIELVAAREGGEVVVRVRDNGIGIAPEAISQLFELFVQGDRSLARSEGGLGIGLTLVRRLVEMHGGSVAATSAGPGQGSEFVVRLPALAQSPRPRPSLSATPSRRGVGPRRRRPDPPVAASRPGGRRPPGVGPGGWPACWGTSATRSGWPTTAWRRSTVAPRPLVPRR